jgi:glycosyltransferase involved in cell wall biosynthesis
MLQGRKIAVYVGNMGIAQGMDVLLELAASLDDREDIGFIFVGRGSEVLRLKDLSRSLRLTNTLFFDEVDSSEMPGLLAQCFVGLVALDPRHKSHNIPGKFPTYLLSGLPVLATVNPKTDLAEIINEEKVGRAFSEDPLSPMKEFFLELIDDSELYSEMSKRALILANRMFSTDEAFKQITRVA